jgi:hypothetical protein
MRADGPRSHLTTETILDLLENRLTGSRLSAAETHLGRPCRPIARIAFHRRRILMIMRSDWPGRCTAKRFPAKMIQNLGMVAAINHPDCARPTFMAAGLRWRRGRRLIQNAQFRMRTPHCAVTTPFRILHSAS